jgi:thioredoxin-related protein
MNPAFTAVEEMGPVMPEITRKLTTFRRNIAIFMILLIISSPLLADTGRIPIADDLSQTAELASRSGASILLLVSQYHCEYCDRMKREILNPMQLSGEYKDQVIMQEIMIDPGEMVTNFAGRRETAEAFADRYGVFVTPTLLFLDPHGNEAAERILGINTIDFLPLYIDSAIENAKQK